MTQYEEAAFQSLEQLKERHDNEIEEHLKNFKPGNFVLSKQVLELKQQEKKMTVAKEFHQAQKFKILAEKIEAQERKDFEEKSMEKLKLEE